MRATLERELKLDVRGESFSLPDLPGEQLPPRTFTSTYHDTPTRSLARAGITLRRRLEKGKSVWQLKLPRSGNDGARDELEAPGGPAGPPVSLKRLLSAHLRHGPLEPVATLRTHRSGVAVVADSRRTADVTVDAVEILDAGRSAGAFTEIEVELVDGGEGDLEALGRLLRKAGARRSPGTPKLLRALELPARDAPPEDAPLHAQLAHFLAVQLAALEARDPGVRLGTDAEDLHRFRVATRRTRALIRVTQPLLGDQLTPLAEELRWLAGRVGAVRDLDVLLDRLGGEVEALDVDVAAARALLGGLEEEREARRAELLQALESPRYLALLTSFDAVVAALPPLGGDGSSVSIARAAVRKAQKAAAALPAEPSDEELHRLRIRAKRARYAAELAALRGDKAAARTVEAFKRLQDVLGEHQDAVVAETRLRTLARAKSALPAGRLIERERERKRSVREAYPSAVSAALRTGTKAFASLV